MSGGEGGGRNDHPEVDDEFDRTSADLDVHHRLIREVVCSLPRGVSCRVCPGERDCPYIVDRPHGRLVVHRRIAHPAVAISGDRRFTGTRHHEDRPRSWPQIAIAIIGWATIIGMVVWTWVIHHPQLTLVVIAFGLLLVTFIETIVGVPLARRRWRDGGGVRRDA